eukprot:SAG11_NODE_228_length_11986_cov_128.901153_2_plen_147_part_00
MRALLELLAADTFSARSLPLVRDSSARLALSHVRGAEAQAVELDEEGCGGGVMEALTAATLAALHRVAPWEEVQKAGADSASAAQRIAMLRGTPGLEACSLPPWFPSGAELDVASWSSREVHFWLRYGGAPASPLACDGCSGLRVL